MYKLVLLGLLFVGSLVQEQATLAQTLLSSSSGRSVAIRQRLLSFPAPAVPASVNAQLLLPRSGRSPTRYPTFNSPVLNQQLERYLKYVAAIGPPEIMVVGSSRVLQGIDPIALEQALAAQGRPGLRVFNFGINGATAQVVSLLLQQILSPQQLPELLIWGDGLRAFNSGRKDATYKAILASAGYQQLFSVGRPIVLVPQPKRRQQAFCIEVPGNHVGTILPWHRSVNPSTGEVKVAMKTGYPSLNQALSATAVTALMQRPPNRSEPCTSRQNRLSSQSRLRRAQTSRFLQPQLLLSNGFSSVPTQFDPKTYYQRYPRVSGRYDGDYVPFVIEGGQQYAALRSVGMFARARRIPLVVVNMPLSQPHLDPVRLAYERQFDQKMRYLAKEQGFRFRNFLQRWPTRNDYFADPSHLNRYGARAVARQLAQDPTIPWPQR